jgi:hypothetical protein
MKNTLAENMLRFGVKNLNETNIEKLKEQAERDLQAVTVQGPVVVEWPAKINLQLGTITLTAKPTLDPTTKQYNINNINIQFDSAAGKDGYNLSTSTMQNSQMMSKYANASNSIMDVGAAVGSKNSKTSLQHLKDFLAAIEKRFKVKVQGGDLERLFTKNTSNGNIKRVPAKQQFPGMEFLPPMSFETDVVYNINTNQPESITSVTITPLQGGNRPLKNKKPFTLKTPIDIQVIYQNINNMLGMDVKSFTNSKAEFNKLAGFMTQEIKTPVGKLG